MAQPVNCDTTFRCDDASDCPGQICCAHLEPEGYRTFSCDNSCTVTEDTDIGCSGPQHCSSSQVCCGEITNDMSPAAHYQRTRCMNTCQSSESLTRYVLCLTTADYPASTTCMASALLPTGFRFCR